jgi:FMN reductase (NADPH)
MLRHRSIRRYRPEPIGEEMVRAILSCAQMAPTSSNKQAYSVIGVTDPTARRRLAEVADGQEEIEECALFLVWCADLHRIRSTLDRIGAPMAYDNLEEFIVATIDVALAAENALVAAESMGLGGVIIGSLRNDPGAVAELLDLPELVYPAFGMCLGYPAEDPCVKPRLPQRIVYHEGRYRSEGFREGLADYDSVMRDYYLRRSDEGRDTTWSSEMARKFRQPERPHMRAFLEGQGFRFD